MRLSLPKRKPPNGDLKRLEEEDKLERLRVRMEDTRGGVDINVSRYVQATLEFGVAQTRKEYRGLANRNWRAIQRFGTRFIRLMVTTAVILLFLGWFSYNTTQEIQDGRYHAVIEKCRAGQAFVLKLRDEIAQLPPGKRAEEEGQIRSTEELVETITGEIDVRIDGKGHLHLGDCHGALRKAGLTP